MKAVLMCHAPIVIPEIAGNRLPEVERTTAAMGAAAQALLKDEPQGVIVVSPHTPRPQGAYGVYGGAELHGDFGDFGFPELSQRLPNDLSMVRELEALARLKKVPLRSLGDKALDHGAMVPLHFLRAAGWKGSTVVVGLSFGADLEMNLKLGEALGELSENHPDWALLLSGDMSHRLTRDAPAGYHPSGKRFDDEFCRRLKEGQWREAVQWNPQFLDEVGEDIVESFQVGCGALGFRTKTPQFLSYEGPFGVGYCVAVLSDS